MQAVEALGGKYHWQCFCCTVCLLGSRCYSFFVWLTLGFFFSQGCENPFEDPSFFLRDNKPFCERCYRIILKSEI
jgi:hypothetical protein